MPHTFYYLRGALGDADLLDEHKTAINALLTGDYTQKNIEKLRGHDVYSLRTGNQNAGRLLFTTTQVAGQAYLLVLEYLPTHNYTSSHFLRSGVLRHYLEQQSDVHAGLVEGAAAEAVAPVFEAAHMPEVTIPEGDDAYEAVLDHYKGMTIALSVSQEEALNLALPAVVSGVAGSGKSCIGVSLLSSFVLEPHHAIVSEGRKPRILYITAPGLVDDIQESWAPLPAAQDTRCTVDILSYEALLAQNKTGEVSTNDRAGFNQWHARYTKNQLKFAKQKKKTYNALSADVMHQEFRVCSGYTEAEYLALGQRKSLLPQAEREALHKAYKAYLGHCAENQVHTELSSIAETLQEENRYDFVVVDEAQDLSFVALSNVHALARNHAIVYCMDSHQSLSDALSVRPYLRERFKTSHTVLERTYRCPVHVVLAANEILHLKTLVTGGLADKLESRRIEAVSEEKEAGAVALLNQAKLQDSEWLAADKGSQFAVVAEEEHHAEAAAYFNTKCVFTPESIKGLERDIVVAYRLFDNAHFKAANRLLSEAAHPAAEAKTHRAKSGAGDSQHGPAFNRVYTAYTRARETLLVFEENTRDTKHLLQAFSHVFASEVPDLSGVSKNNSTEDWIEATNTLLQVGNDTLAQSIFERHVSSEPGAFDVFLNRLRAPQLAAQPAPSGAASVVPASSGDSGSSGGGAKLAPTQVVVSQGKSKSESEAKVSRPLPSKHTSASSKKGINAYVETLFRDFTKDHLREALQYYALNALLSVNHSCDSGKKGNKSKKITKTLLEFIKEDLSRINLFFQCIEEKEVMASKSMDDVRKKSISIFEQQLKLEKMTKPKESERKEALIAGLTRLAGTFVLSSEQSIIEKLIMCVDRGLLDTMTQLLADAGINPNLANDKDVTPLTLAVDLGNLDIVKALLADRRINPNQEPGPGLMPLYLAAQCGHTEIVSELLGHKKIRVDLAVGFDATPIFIAALNGHLNTVNVLLADGRIDPNQTKSNGEGALGAAAENGHIEIVKALLADGRANPSQASYRGFTPLLLAGSSGHIKVLRALLADKRTDPNQAEKELGLTILIVAIENRDIKVIAMLLGHERTDPNLAGKDGPTPLHWAVEVGSPKIVEALLEHKDINTHISCGNQTPLELAEEKRLTEVAKLLRAHENPDYSGQASGAGEVLSQVGMFSRHAAAEEAAADSCKQNGALK